MTYSQQKAIALLSLAETMVNCEVSAEQCATENFDEARIEIMMHHGLTSEEAVKMLSVDPQSLVTGE